MRAHMHLRHDCAIRKALGLCTTFLQETIVDVIAFVVLWSFYFPFASLEEVLAICVAARPFKFVGPSASHSWGGGDAN